MRPIVTYGPSLVVLCAAGLVLLVGPTVVRNLTFEKTKAEIVQAELSLGKNDVLEQMNHAYRDIATLVEPSVVHISATHIGRDRFGRASLAISSGSGWIYDETGHVVTNAHVVQDAQRIEVQLYTGELRSADVVGIDQFTDIAVLKIVDGRLSPARQHEGESEVQQGDMVFAFGSPFDFRFSMSSGVVSGKGRSVGVIRDEQGRPFGYENFIQVDAAINPGNSGGPLTDIEGRVIGMNTAIATGQEEMTDEGRFAGIGLAIPMEMIRPVVTQLIQVGRVDKGYMGVTLAEINPINAQDLGFYGRGVGVSTVAPNGPAEVAGLKPGDIISKINGQSVESISQMRSVISSMLPGAEATLSVWRYDTLTDTSKTTDVQVKLAKLDMQRLQNSLPENQPTDRIEELGIQQMETMTPELAERKGMKYMPGVFVEKWVPGSMLEGEVGNGVIITKVMGVEVGDVNEFIAALRRVVSLRDGARVTILGKDGLEVTVGLRIP